jgi:transposase-like protein
MKAHQMGNQRRKFSDEQKIEIVLEILSGKTTASEVSRRLKIKDSLIYNWRKAVLERLPHLFKIKPADEECQQRVAELERKIGQLAMDNDALKKASSALSRNSK